MKTPLEQRYEDAQVVAKARQGGKLTRIRRVDKQHPGTDLGALWNHRRHKRNTFPFIQRVIDLDRLQSTLFPGRDPRGTPVKPWLQHGERSTGKDHVYDGWPGWGVPGFK